MVDPRALEKLAGRLGHGVVLVAGTNGKTTTSRILSEILAAGGESVVHNRAGANLVGGIVSTLATSSGVGARQHSAIAVLETDEAALPAVVHQVMPTVVVLTNLFRDQLDRFAETDQILARWRRALAGCPSATLVVNADDPALVAMTDGLPNRRVLFGIEESVYRMARLPHSAEVIRCARCDRALDYHQIFVGHLGDWYCARCDVGRPRLDVAAHAIELWASDFQSMRLRTPATDLHLELGLPGLFNSYNVLAAATAAQILGVSEPVVQQTVREFRGAFGRGERVVHRGHTMTVMLVKNPVGCDEVLRAIGGTDRGTSAPLMFALNDDAADGRDVSWIWDVDFEQVADWEVDVFCAGSRAADLHNRLHYAGVPRHRLHELGADLGAAFDVFADAIPAGDTGFILPTYTALLQLRAAVAERTHLASFWAE